MTLTIDERYTAYCIMLEEIESMETLYSTGVCLLICDLFCPVVKGYWDDKSVFYVYDLTNFSNQFPELYNYRKGKRPNEYWFKNWNQRKTALRKCIAETSNF